MEEVVLTLSKGQIHRLKALKKKYEKESIEEVILMALLLMDECEDEIVKGDSICIVNDFEGVTKVIKMR